MPDMTRRGLLRGALVGGTTLGTAGAVQAFGPLDRAAVMKRAPAMQDWANLARYRAANAEALAGPASARRVVMMGDSITQNWARYSGGFFAAHGLVGRGISGQLSAQMLVRFWPDVIALKPRLVHIMAGTNDLVGDIDPYDAQATQDNLSAMVSLAKTRGIGIVMASVPPASGFAWGGAMEALKALNAWINDLCAKEGYTYCDYWPVLEATGGKLKPELGLDTVHPNAAGYAAMGPVLLASIDAALKRKAG